MCVSVCEVMIKSLWSHEVWQLSSQGEIIYNIASDSAFNDIVAYIMSFL